MSTHPSATPEPEIYRRIIDWDKRLAREGPFLQRTLGLRPGARILDLGSATGEHDRWLAARGAEVVGVDRSADMVEAARGAAEGDPRLTYVEADLATLPDAVRGPFDGALCVGNTLVHLLDAEAVAAFAAGVAERLRPGGALIVQVLNYEAIVRERRRAFPPSFRPDGDGELVFLRFMEHAVPGFVDFESVVLRRAADEAPALVMSRRSRVRAWTRADLVPAFESAIGTVEVLGGMAGEAYDPVTSGDLVLVARRR